MNVMLTPVLDEDAVELSTNKWRKQILPKGRFNYKGSVLDFDAMASDLVLAHNAKAMDQVPFVFADAKNQHNDDPKNYGGELSALEITDKGLYGTFDFTGHPETAEYVSKNKKFGVSARIERGVDRGGKAYPAVLSHVLGTLNPRVAGMDHWEEVDLSNVDTDAEVDNLSGETLTPVTEDRKGAGVTLSQEQVDFLTQLMKDTAETEKTIAALSQTDDDGESAAITLANDTAKAAIKLAQETQLELSKTRWAGQASSLVRDGVPPALVELAKPIMETPDNDSQVITLSAGGSTSTKEQVFKLLEAAKGIVDLSAEDGHELADDSSEDDEEWKAIEADILGRMPR